MRIFITINETNPLEPMPELHINGYRMLLTKFELKNLAAEINWALNVMDTEMPPEITQAQAEMYERMAK